MFDDHFYKEILMQKHDYLFGPSWMKVSNSTLHKHFGIMALSRLWKIWFVNYLESSLNRPQLFWLFKDSWIYLVEFMSYFLRKKFFMTSFSLSCELIYFRIGVYSKMERSSPWKQILSLQSRPLLPRQNKFNWVASLASLSIFLIKPL